MIWPAAYADSSGSGNSLELVLSAAGIIAGTALAAFILVGVARTRGHARADVILLCMIVWGVLTAGSLMWALQAEMNWKSEYNTRIMSGYYDPTNASDAPKMPWVLWGGLAAGYAGLLGWALAGGARNQRPPDAG